MVEKTQVASRRHFQSIRARTSTSSGLGQVIGGLLMKVKRQVSLLVRLSIMGYRAQQP